MLAMMRHAVGRGRKHRTLEVRENNMVAQRLYAGLGFEQNGFRPGYYSDTGEGAIILWNNNIQQTLDREK
jgi:ribosomal-protein-alanine N-acetyltransferase